MSPLLSILRGRPDIGLLKAGQKLQPMNPLWSLAGYLVGRKKPPLCFFHPDRLAPL